MSSLSIAGQCHAISAGLLFGAPQLHPEEERYMLRRMRMKSRLKYAALRPHPLTLDTE